MLWDLFVLPNFLTLGSRVWASGFTLYLVPGCQNLEFRGPFAAYTGLPSRHSRHLGTTQAIPALHDSTNAVLCAQDAADLLQGLL